MMRRDLDIYRDQLLQIEQLAEGTDDDLTLDKKGISHRVFNEHLRLLMEGGFIDADEIPDTEDGSTHYQPIRLTYRGHEYLDAIRDPEIWKEAKQGAALVGGITFDLLKDLAIGFIKKQIKDKTGVDL